MNQKKMLRALSVLLCLVLLSAVIPAQAVFPTLRKGSKGDSVRLMQQALAKLGYAVKADGSYGPATQRAVSAFQRVNGLKVDGVAGHRTLSRLYSESAKPYVPAPATDKYATVATQRNRILYLRSTPSSRNKSNIITMMPRGANITILEKGGTWTKVRYNGRTGYAMTAFLSFPSTIPLPEPKVTPGDPTKAIVATQPGRSLNLRSSKDSSTKANIMAYIPSSLVVDLLERGPSWCKVRYKGMTGYVMTGFLRFP
jgi:peptidoglycan hydrolase-like protein with peptidoglycan-binding domain